MPPDIRERFQSALGEAYRLERELGGGGMSRVFAAEEAALGRRVVVKLLPPELAAEVSLDRFRHEVRVLAGLHHPNIVPLLSAGEADGILYYTMPLVEGASLRARLARDGPLPVTEVVEIVHDVARALAHAHAHGVVHRDIKPDNVLLAGSAAVVTDFGIAKALAAARRDEDQSLAPLTGTGTTVGTPDYMAPEQVAADPATDHRADIYALGAMAYELLAGRPPFSSAEPARRLIAQLTESAVPIETLRPDVPPALAALVAQCLEKDPERRPSGATEVLERLAAVRSGGGPMDLLSPGRHRRLLTRALALYAAAFLLVAVVAWTAMNVIGLPDWSFTGALVVMALGLPPILLTALVHHQARLARAARPSGASGPPTLHRSVTMLAVRAHPHLTWRRVALGGVLAVGAFALGVAGYMLMRALGIGPVGSLMAAGVIGEREPVLVTDFRGPATDTALGPVVSEALRADLSQSPSILVVQPASMREALSRMRRPAGARVDLALARELAAREGITAIVDGDVHALGSQFLLTGRIVAARSGDVLASYRSTAEGPDEVIPAVDDLSKRLRARVGESLKTIRREPPLARVTTGSLEALRKYVQGVRAFETDADFVKGVALLEEAIALDSGFAMAYRKLAIELANRGGPNARSEALMRKAFDHRDRLSEPERLLTVAGYYSGPGADEAKAIAAYEELLELQPDNAIALNNVALFHMFRHEYERAEAYLLRAIAADSLSSVEYGNLADVQLRLGRPQDASATAERFRRNLPDHPGWRQLLAMIAAARGHHDSAASLLRENQGARTADAATREDAAAALGAVAQVRGRLAEARSWLRQRGDAQVERGVATGPLQTEIDIAMIEARVLDDPQRALRVVEDALRRQPLDSLAPLDRPYFLLTLLYGAAGRPERARALLDAFDRRSSTTPRLDDDSERAAMLRAIALAEGRYEDLVREHRRWLRDRCTICPLADLGRAYDLAGVPDSAIAYYERYLATPFLYRVFMDRYHLAAAHERLGALYERRGEHARAIEHYRAFVALWEEADPELQPRVRAARARLERLDVEGGGKRPVVEARDRGP